MEPIDKQALTKVGITVAAIGALGLALIGVAHYVAVAAGAG